MLRFFRCKQGMKRRMVFLLFKGRKLRAKAVAGFAFSIFKVLN